MTLLTLQAWRICCPVQPNVGANRVPTVWRQARAADNVTRRGPGRLYAVSCGTRQPYLTAAVALNG